MALSDSKSQKTLVKKDRRISESTNKHWSDDQKREAIKTYMLLGNLAMTARMLAIPEITLRVWKTTEWWKDTMDEFKQEEKVELSAKTKKIIDAALTVTADRMENGNWFFNPKSGVMERKPVDMKDAHKVATDLIDKKEKLDKVSNEVANTVENDLVRLERIANKLAEFASKKKEIPLVEDVSDAEVKE